MARNLVCGTVVREGMAKLKSTCKDKTFYFCAKAWKDRFDSEPQEYVKK